MQDVSPLGNHRPEVEITESGGCPSCLFMKALSYLLDHGTGTGSLKLNEEELTEIGEPDLILMVLRFRKE